MQVWYTNSRWFQLFRYKDEFIVNTRGLVFDVSGNHDRENQRVIVHSKHGGLNQRWTIMYVDDMTPDPKKGEEVKEWGLSVYRPFHIVS